MNKLLISSMALALTAGSSLATAGGIQINPTGGGLVAGSTFLVDPGNSFGNALAQGVFPLPAPVPSSGTMYMQNAIDISSSMSIIGAELSFVMDIPVLASHFPVPGAPGGINYDTAGGSGVGTFSLYYHDSVNTGGVAATKSAGTGFTDDVLLASGTVTLTGGASWLFTSAVPGLVPLASNDPTPTIQGAGSTSFDIDFTFLDPAYVVNDLTGLTIDMDMSNTLSTPFTGMGVASSSFAEAGAGAISYGLDGTNDYTCGPFGGFTCDMQMMANTTLNFRAQQTPEPATLALMGLGLVGLAARRRRKSA